ncbi:hypothetical protein B0A55_00515 [Friedmanniomyces simplex]|uniref:F-box domain-containing protein n=1 Tax=Friedmanniomyces simplex TaxID=329884 RepID=A0A4U0Y791_9PEZI|nr:hypothetical protein B0A55_00515 [Friedmanniomyces simplex]
MEPLPDMEDDGESEAYATAVRYLERRHYKSLLNGVDRASWELKEYERALHDLHLLLDHSTAVPEAVHSALATLDRPSTATLHQLTTCGEHREEVWKPTEKSARLANEVFGIPELCEQIFNQLTSRHDLASVIRVNRATMAVMRGSTSIQKTLGLVYDKSRFWTTPFGSAYRGFHCYMDDMGSRYLGTKERTPERATIVASFSSTFYDFS